MTTIMCEVPGLDSFLSGAAESNRSGTGGKDNEYSGGTGHELARVVSATPRGSVVAATAAGASGLCCP
jgi:hypothetical protein